MVDVTALVDGHSRMAAGNEGLPDDRYRVSSAPNRTSVVNPFAMRGRSWASQPRVIGRSPCNAAAILRATLDPPLPLPLADAGSAATLGKIHCCEASRTRDHFAPGLLSLPKERRRG